MYVCTYVRTYVCMYVCMYVYVYACMYVCVTEEFIYYYLPPVNRHAYDVCRFKPYRITKSVNTTGQLEKLVRCVSW